MSEHTVVARDLPDGSEVSLAGPDAVCAGATPISRALAGWLEYVLALPFEAGVRWLDEEKSDRDFGVERISEKERVLVAPEARVRLPIATIQGALKALLEARLGGELFWLFRPRPFAFLPSAADRTFVEDLERRVRGFDDELRAGELAPGTESARRLLLLAEIEEAGLLERTLGTEKLYWLRVWGLPGLASVAAAARDLWDYFRSPERARHLGEPPPVRLIGTRVSLDWMRAPAPIPTGWSSELWLAVVERCLRDFEPLPPGAKGQLMVAQGRVSAQVLWRREDGEHPALYGARLSERAEASAR